MISVDFEYYGAHSIEEAMHLFRKLSDEGKAPLFYNGGTEIITLMRTNTHYTGTKAVIDIKRIPECTVYEFFEEDYLVIGASVTLAQIEEKPVFPLLSKNCSRIADHTSREKITIGGNICGNIKYKEAILPLLLTNCHLVIADETGMREVPIQELFEPYIRLDPGSFIVQIKINKRFLTMLFSSKKITKNDRIGYPLLTVSALQTDKEIRFAFSGLCEYPFRSSTMELALNNEDQSIYERITSAIEQMPATVLDDMEGSASYRKFVLRHVLEEIITVLTGGEGHEAIG